MTPHERGTIDEIRQVFSSVSGGYMINLSDISSSLSRLEDHGRIVRDSANSATYELSQKSRREMAEVLQQAEQRFQSVVAVLFKNAGGEASAYEEPFLKALCNIFSQLGEESVRLIKGDIKSDEFLKSPSITLALKLIEKDFPSIDPVVFGNAVMTFFQINDPDFDEIKWNMTQNYFVAKALGLDPSGALLSKEVFEDAVFYLDTNVLIVALESKSRYHRSFLTFAKACKQLGVTFKVCQISLDELNRVLAYQRDLIIKVMDQIPEQTAGRVRSVFYEIYLERKKAGETVEIDDLFSSFSSPMKDLEESFGAELDDDIWFDNNKEERATQSFANDLGRRYLNLRLRTKSQRATLHDALLLLWIQKTRQETPASNVLLVTADTSLPGCVPRNSLCSSLAITSDALLQWISPLIAAEETGGNFAEVFSEMIKYRLLPQDRFFALEDFLIFHEMHMSCRELPAQDVEECIRYIKTHAYTLDPSRPSDREKLAYEVSKFFADPGRKYLQEIARLEQEKTTMRDDFESRIGEAQRQINDLEQEHKSQLGKRDTAISELKSNFDDFRRATGEDSIRRSAYLRVGFTFLVFLMLEGLTLSVASQYGEGKNLFQRLLNAWAILGVAVPAVTIIVGWFLIGKERLKSLGWPFERLFKQDK